MLTIQIIAVLFALFAFGVTVVRFKEKKISAKEFIFWDIIWLSVVIVAMLPWTTSIIAKLLGIRRGIDVAIYLGIIILFYLVFKMYVKVENVEREITKLVREEAIKRRKK